MNCFNKESVDQQIERINKLSSDTKAQWGTMDVAKMLAHCNVSYEMVYDNIHKKPNAFLRTILKLAVKNKVVGDKPYPKNGQTAPQFIIKSDKDFEVEKTRLVNYINKTLSLGEKEFEGKESLSFGKLTSKEWNNLFFKHLDHHLRQFNV